MPAQVSKRRIILIWFLLFFVALAPIGIAATSPLLEWREPVYIAAGFCGIAALALLLFQPLLAAGVLPGLSALRGRRVHRVSGGTLLLLVLLHVAGLWITSPPDVIDALLFVSATPFSVWGVIAMWAIVATTLLAGFRRRLSLRPSVWRTTHKTLAVIIVAGTAVHAMLIEGAMGYWSKLLLCLFVVIVSTLVLSGRWSGIRK